MYMYGIIRSCCKHAKNICVRRVGGFGAKCPRGQQLLHTQWQGARGSHRPTSTCVQLCREEKWKSSEVKRQCQRLTIGGSESPVGPDLTFELVTRRRQIICAPPHTMDASFISPFTRYHSITAPPPSEIGASSTPLVFGVTVTISSSFRRSDR